MTNPYTIYLMHTVRIIPRLDIKGPNLVKGIQLEGLRVLGTPAHFAKFYAANGADELLYTDVVASLYGRNSLDAVISDTAQSLFVPLTIGGGLRSLDDIRRVLRFGADKVSLNTAAIQNPAIIEQAAKVFGSSTIVLAIEALLQPNGKYLAYTDNGREFTGVEVASWAQHAENLGAGEILLTSIDREGTGTGFDLDLIHCVRNKVKIPIIAHGGAGQPQHVWEAIQAGADAIALSSLLHYDYIQHHHSDKAGNESQEGNVHFLKSGRLFSKIESASLSDVKAFLKSKGVQCR